MSRQLYLDLAAQHVRLPIGADLVLREHADHAAILLDGRRYANVLLEAADRYHTPLAIPVMDLMLEKAALQAALGITESPDTFHFKAAPDAAAFTRFDDALRLPLPPRMQCQCDAIRHVAQSKKHLALGMSIGPVSLMTKLLADPITPIFIAGTGTTAAEDEEVLLVEKTLDLALRMVLHSVQAQIKAGARAIFIAEPAANKAFFSPHQLGASSSVWERYVMTSNRAVKALLDAHGIDLLFHCCGELVEPMVQSFASLDPVLLSLGASRDLWQDAALVPNSTVLYGNLPTKKFYSDEVMTPAIVADLTRSLLTQMSKTNHPFILGSECDVLHVPGSEKTIKNKVDIMLTCQL